MKFTTIINFAIWIVIIALFSLGLILLCGCKNFGMTSQTTVMGLEVVMSGENYIPSARVGLITHRNNVIALDSVKRINQLNNYYIEEMNLWKGQVKLNSNMTNEVELNEDVIK